MKNLKQLISNKQYIEAKQYIIENRDRIEDVADTLLAVIDELQSKQELINDGPYKEVGRDHLEKVWNEFSDIFCQEAKIPRRLLLNAVLGVFDDSLVDATDNVKEFSGNIRPNHSKLAEYCGCREDQVKRFSKMWDFALEVINKFREISYGYYNIEFSRINVESEHVYFKLAGEEYEYVARYHDSLEIIDEIARRMIAISREIS